MKKLFMTVAMAATICISASAQEAFKHLSLGLEAGTAGLGAELALPVVTNHLVIKAGATFPNIKASYAGNYDISAFSQKVNEYVNTANEYLARAYAGADQLIPLGNTTRIDATAKLNTVAFKAILEYYPAKNSNFHISAGIYAGNEQLLAADGTAADLWNVYETDASIARQYPDLIALIGDIPDLTANINGKTYQIKSPGSVNLALSAWKVRPYFGIGFGRSVPTTRCGFQFDLGAVYLGKTSFTSTNEIPYQPSSVEIGLNDSEVSNVMNFFARNAFYPVLNLRFILRLF